MKFYKIILIKLILFVFVGIGLTQETAPSLSINQNQVAEAGGVGIISVNLDAGISDITAIAFSIDYDESVLAYDEAVDAFICFNETLFTCTLMPPNLLDTDGELDFVVMSVDSNVSIPSGEILSLPFLINSSTADNTIASVAISVSPSESYGNNLGASVPRNLATNGFFLVRRTSLDVQFALQGQTDFEGAIRLRLYDSQGNLVNEQLPLASENGLVNMSSITSGTYQLAVKSDKSLQVVVPIDLTIGSNTINVGTLMGGDADNDNRITLQDFSILTSSFNLGQSDEGYDDRADFNEDNLVTLADFSLLTSNFNVAGEEPSSNVTTNSVPTN
ncbi:MAG: hypothetical protein WBC91_25320 [Phototrophicaceae bacterium]